MEWGKAKNVLIVVLLIANIALGINLIKLNDSKVKLSEEYLTRSCEILKQRGLDVKIEGLSRRKNNLPTVIMPMKDLLYSTARAALSDLTLAPSSGQGSTRFLNSQGNFTIFQNHEILYLSKGADIGLKGFLNISGYKNNDFVLSEDGKQAQLLLNGAKLLGFTLEKTKDEKSWGVKGKLLGLDQKREDNSQFMDAVNALFFLASYLQSNDILGETVTTVEEAYHITTNAAFNTVIANPVYVIITERTTYYVDAVSGQILNINL